jgi:hypothetical protein
MSPFSSSITCRLLTATSHIEQYDAERKNASSVRDIEHRQKALDPAVVAEVVLRIVNSKSPKIRYAVGREKGAIRLKTLVPEGIYENFTRRHLRELHPQALEALPAGTSVLKSLIILIFICDKLAP